MSDARDGNEPPTENRLEYLVREFDAAWRRGGRPSIDDCLPADVSRRKPALIELVHTDLEYRLKSGELIRVEDYLRRYPELCGDKAAVLDLIVAEHAFRSRREPGLTRDHYFARFPDFRAELTARLPPADPPPPADRPADPTPTLLDRPKAMAAQTKGVSPRVSGYEILAELGRGGMGVVYKARQVGLNRLVALKMILTGAHAGPEDSSRLRGEAEAAARLQHPHIVQIYDIGEQGGLPYLSLEYVDGGTLAQRLVGALLPPRQAAELLQTLARAVHYAHEHGVVHRDLKPGNVLLSFSREPPASASADALAGGSRLNEGDAKITDFGLAKLTETESGLTRTGALLGTPSYMSPEQADGRNRDVGPASDVYSLGAVLYECLTGRPPFRAATAQETMEQVRQQDPVPPRRLQPTVPIDLDTITLKCLQKEPASRYASAKALAEDLRRFLAGEPILARPLGRTARLWRWCRREPRVAVLTAALLLACVLGFAGVTVQLLRAERERARAERRFEQVRDGALAFLFDFDGMIQNLPGALPARELIVKKALDDLEDLSREAGGDPALLQGLGEAYRKVGEVQVNLGRPTDALASFRKGLELLEAVPPDHPGRDDLEQIRATCYLNLTAVYRSLNKKDEARDACRLGLDLAVRLAQAHPTDAKVRRCLAAGHHRRGGLYHADGQLKEALVWHEEGLRLMMVLAAENPKDRQIRRELANSHLNVGGTHWAAKRNLEAAASYRTALALLEELSDADPYDATTRQSLSLNYFVMASVALKSGRPVEALASAEKGLSQVEKLCDMDPHNTHLPRERAIYYMLLASIHATLGQDDNESPSKRLDCYTRARTWCERSRGAFQMMQRKGLLLETDAGSFASLAQMLGNIEEAIAKMKPP